MDYHGIAVHNVAWVDIPYVLSDVQNLADG